MDSTQSTKTRLYAKFLYKALLAVIGIFICAVLPSFRHTTTVAPRPQPVTVHLQPDADPAASVTASAQ